MSATLLRLLVLIGAATAIPPLAASHAATYVVDPDGGGTFPTIQAALNACTHGDVVELTDGVFAGDGNRDLDFRGTALTLRSRGGSPEDCVIDCGGSPGDPHRGFRFSFGEPAGATVRGITVRNGHASGPDAGRGGAMDLSSRASPTIRDCRFENNFAGWGGAIACRDHSCPVITGCVFVDNTAAYGAAGIDLEDQCRPLISSCTFWRNRSQGHGVALSCVYSYPTIVHCTFVENVGFSSPAIGVWSGSALRMETSIVTATRSGSAVLCEDANAALSCCDLFDNDHGDWVSCVAGQYGLEGNIAADPEFCDPQAGDFQLACTSPCVPQTPPHGDCERMGAWGVGCGASPVDHTSWGGLRVIFRGR